MQFIFGDFTEVGAQLNKEFGYNPHLDISSTQ